MEVKSSGTITMSTQSTIVLEAKKQQNYNNAKPLTGFQLHPENINKKGRPKREWTWKELFEDAIEEEHETKLGKMTVREIIARKLCQLAMNGNLKAAKEIMDRMDGKPTQRNELTGKDGAELHPIPILGGITNDLIDGI